mgnify:CR=1 FL=1
MTAPLLLYRMVRDYIKMNEITNKILYFPLNLFFNLKFLMRLVKPFVNSFIITPLYV